MIATKSGTNGEDFCNMATEKKKRVKSTNARLKRLEKRAIRKPHGSSANARRALEGKVAEVQSKFLEYKGIKLRYRTVRELRKSLEVYFVDCDESGTPYTMEAISFITGLSLDILRSFKSDSVMETVIEDACNKVKISYAERIAKTEPGLKFLMRNNFVGYDAGNKPPNSLTAIISSDDIARSRERVRQGRVKVTGIPNTRVVEEAEEVD